MSRIGILVDLHRAVFNEYGHEVAESVNYDSWKNKKTTDSSRSLASVSTSLRILCKAMHQRASRLRKNSLSGRITLKALASYLKLSPTTVSFVVNESPLASTISFKTQQRIWDAVLKFNYRPNIFARYLHTKRTFSIAVLLGDVSDEFSAALVSGIDICLTKNGYFYFIVSHRGAPEMMEKSPDTLLDRAVEGMIFISTHIKRLLPVPVVTICDATEGPGITRIAIDNAKAATLGLEHLLKLGHREIAVIKGPPGNGDTEDRWQQILKASARKKIRISPDQTVQLESYPTVHKMTMSENGYRAALKLLAKNRSFTALLAFNDASAIGVIRAFSDVGLRIPEDISVVGFDDIPQGMFTFPRLTTIRQPLTAMGELAANTLLKKIAGRGDGPKILRIDPELIVRESTSPCSNQRHPVVRSRNTHNRILAH
jgi:DNA-binding LacI/PurR family transcriptional regulator